MIAAIVAPTYATWRRCRAWSSAPARWPAGIRWRVCVHERERGAAARISELTKKYPTGPKRTLPWSKRVPSFLHAVDEVSLAIAQGESIGLVGESGCGKSTLARLIARLIDPTAGSIRLGDDDIGATTAAHFATHPLRGRLQVVFQDPTDSLNPRYTAADTIGEPLALLGGMADSRQRAQRVTELADSPVCRGNC